MSNSKEVTILCEGRQDEVFIRRFLNECGINRHRIRVVPYPKGKGAGEQHIREQYPTEVKAHRSRAAYQKSLYLIVMTDADTKTVTKRQRELEDALSVAGQDRRKATERIALFVPKRNVETWIHYLMGKKVNETDAYPKLTAEGDCETSVKRVAAKSEYRLTADAPPSLRLACGELTRIFPTKRCVELVD